MTTPCFPLQTLLHTSQHTTAKPYWLEYDATRRGAIITPATTTIKMCSEPSPDAAFSLVSKLQASLDNPEASKANATAEFNASIVKLAERTQMVMFLREALFRLCEQSLNQDFTKAEVLDAYKEVIKAATAIAEADRDRAKEAAARAVKGLTGDQLKSLDWMPR